MIDIYFEKLEKTALDFKGIINNYAIYKKSYNLTQGYIKGEIYFKNDCRLCFIEVKNTDIESKNKYRYQYMTFNNSPIFRYDNAHHHTELDNFPHHRHNGVGVHSSNEPSLYDILL